jgi:hypothetical protein
MAIRMSDEVGKTLKDDFNRINYTATKQNDYLLQVDCSPYLTYYVDFMARITTVFMGRGQSNMAVVPFSQMDPAAITSFRDELKRQGGNPPDPNELDKAPTRTPGELKL